MNHPIEHRGNELYIESISAAEIAKEFGTPTYVYSRALIEEAFNSYKNMLTSHRSLICYAVKANSNLAVLDILVQLGAGFDIVSEGELKRVLTAGGDPGKIVFSGVGKTPSEMNTALKSKIYCFNVESESELNTLNEVSKKMGEIAPISIRINPNVNPTTHPYIATGMRKNKFGVPKDEVIKLYEKASKLKNISVQGIDCHIGSQLVDINPLIESIQQLLEIVDELKRMGINLEHINLGGGLGITYRDEAPPSIADYIQSIVSELGDNNLKLIIEPGRSIIGNAGILITEVQYLKTTSHRNFAIVDAAMNDMLRPALYDAWLEILPISKRHGIDYKTWDIVGPVCESGDFLGHQRNLAIKERDILAVLSAGAYGSSMSSNYNSRCRAAEVIVDSETIHLARKRESFNDLILGENLLAKTEKPRAK